jgi:hypothetical protein
MSDPQPGSAVGGVTGRQALMAVALIFLVGILIGVGIGLALSG